MTKNYIVKELINQMKERIPPGHNLANYLTDTLYMGKKRFIAGCEEKLHSPLMK